MIARRSPVPFFVLVLLAGGSAACARPGDAPTPAPGAPSVAVATVDAAVATADAAVAAVDAAPPPSVLPPKLRLTGRERKDGTMECTPRSVGLHAGSSSPSAAA